MALHACSARALLAAAIAVNCGCCSGVAGGQACAAGFELWRNTSCGGTPLQTLHLPTPDECCAACGGTAKCLAWEFRNDTARSGMPMACLLLRNPGTLGNDAGTTCGVYRDTPPGAACLSCMALYPNQTIDTTGDTYLQLLTNTSDECCGRCTADADRCVTWRWTQLQYAATSFFDEWFNCELLDGDLSSVHNVSNGRPMLSGAMIGARHSGGPSPSPPPVAKDGYIGCFIDLLHGARRDLPFFFCSNQSDPTPMSGTNYCAEDPRLPPVLPGTSPESTASPWAGARRMSPALCSMLCHDFDFYSVQNGSLCFCSVKSNNDGKGYGAFGVAPETECSAKCTDPHAAAAGAKCGGVERNSVYKILDTPPLALPSKSSFEHVGCFPDQQGVEQMPALPIFFCPNAQQHCPGEEAGWGGIASDCVGSALELPAQQCSGDMEQENCARLPNTKSGRGGFMTHELCDVLCIGFEFFAVQSGYRCYCGQSYGTQGNISQPSWCNQKCTGDKSQVCGGNCRGFHSASSVYRRNQHVSLKRRERESAAARGAAQPDGDPEQEQEQQSGGQASLGDTASSHCHLIPSCNAPNASVDWASNEGVVVANVGDQGGCNASWAFAAAAAVESASAIATGKLVHLSVQGIVDCAWRFGGQSCKGGEVNRGLMHAQNNGLYTIESYPYRGENAHCCRDNCPVGVPGQEDGGVQGFCNVPAASESALISALNQQPIAVGLALPPGFLQRYKGGVYQEDYRGRMNEAALAVGYGSLPSGEKYWKVKLFRGPSFGLGGFVLLARGGDTGPLGQCSILAAASYPVVTKPEKSYPRPGKAQHYGPPPCLESEVEMRVAGLDGTICTTPCATTAGDAGGCPSSGQCDLQDPKTKAKYCTKSCVSDCHCAAPERCVTSVYLAGPICVTVGDARGQAGRNTSASLSAAPRSLALN
jgi:hypothetical protein